MSIVTSDFFGDFFNNAVNSWFTAVFCFKSECLIQILFEFFRADYEILLGIRHICLNGSNKELSALFSLARQN